MLAPLKKGQVGIDRVEVSSSDLDEDTPLLSRLNSEGANRLNNAGRPRPRPIKTKIAGFVIPRKKKAANELLQLSNFNTREGKDLLRNVVQTFRDPNSEASFKFEKLELVSNDQLSKEYQEKKQSMKSEGRNPRELEDKYAFRYTSNRQEAKEVCKSGLKVRSTSVSCLGDPSMGVYLCRHADVISRKALPLALGYLIVFKVMKGKVKQVTERTGVANKELLEPTPNFDCHVSRSLQSLPANSPPSQIFESSQYYFYEFAEEGDDLHVKRPRQCLPCALLSFTFGNPSMLQEPLVPQSEMPTVETRGLVRVVSPVARQDSGILDKPHAKSRHILWHGKIANKDRVLADIQLICHSLEVVKLPFDIGEKIVMKEKISFQQLRTLLTFPLFRTGPPAISKTCKATLAGGASLLHCDLLPVKDDHGKIKKLINFFQEKNWAGIVKCPDANRVIFLIPTSQITSDLGITTPDSPISLHVLLFFGKQKPSKGTASARTQKSREIKTVTEIQDELKRQFCDVKEAHALADLRRLSLETAKPKHASASRASVNAEEFYDSDFETEVTSEEKANYWKDAVEKWISRPNPLHTVVTSANKAPRTRLPATESLPISFPELVHPGSSSSSKASMIPAEQFGETLSRKVTGDSRMAKEESATPASPLLMRKEQHREDPRLKQHSVETEPRPGFESPEPCRNSNSIIYNAQEAEQEKGVVEASITDQESVKSSSSTGGTQVQYQVDEKSLKMILDNLLQSQKEVKSYQVSVDDGTRKALELFKHHKESQSEGSNVKEDVTERGLEKLIPEQAKIQHSGPQDDVSKRNVEVMEQQQETQDGSSNLQNRREFALDSNTMGKSNAADTTGDKTSVLKNDQNSTDNKDETPVRGVLLQKQAEDCCDKKQGKRRALDEEPKSNKVKAPKRQDMDRKNPVSESVVKPMEPSAVPELAEDPFPAISSDSLESFRNPSPNSNRARKAPKLKLILSKSKTAKGTSTPSLPEKNDLLGNKLDDLSQPAQRNSKLAKVDKPSPDDTAKERKTSESPVAMDISPVRTTPDIHGTVSPITVVSSKGRYNRAVSYTAVHSSQTYAPLSSTCFPFSPSLPQGPYRSPISPVQPPIPLSSPLESSISLPGASFPCVPAGASMPSSVGSMQFTPSSQVMVQVPQPSPVPPPPLPPPPPPPPPVHIPPLPPLPPQSEHVPPLPSHVEHVPPPPPPPFPPTESAPYQMPPLYSHAVSVQRNNGADSMVVSLPGSSAPYPTALPGPSVASLSTNQGFGIFNQSFQAPSRPVLPPADVRQPVVFQFGGAPQLPLPRAPTDVPVIQSQALGFSPITPPIFSFPMVTPQATPILPPQGPHVLPQGPVAHSQGPQTVTSLGPPLPPHGVVGTPQMTLNQSIVSASAPFSVRPSIQQPSIQPTVGFWAAPFVKNFGIPHPPPHHFQVKKHSNESLASKPAHKGSELKNVVDAKVHRNSTGKKLDDTCSNKTTSLPEANKDKPREKSEKLVDPACDKSMTPQALSAESVNEETEPRASNNAKDRLEEQSLDSVCSRNEQNLDINNENPQDEDPRSVGSCLIKEDKVLNNGKQPSESQTSDPQETAEVSSTLPANSTDKAKGVDSNISLLSPATDRATELEQMSVEAQNKISYVLRYNPYDASSNTESAVQGEVELGGPDKSEDLDFDPDADVEEGVSNEEKLIFSGEDSSASEPGVHLGSGLHVVQVLDLVSSESDKEKEKIAPDSSVPSKEPVGDGKSNSNSLSELMVQSNKDKSHQNHPENLPKSSEWESISDASDEGTPERDLPGFGSIDIEFKQVWPETAEISPKNVPESTASRAFPKPEAESSTTSKHQSKHCKETSLKRKRNSDSRSAHNDKVCTPVRKKRTGSSTKQVHKESPDQKSGKKAEKRCEEKPKRLRGYAVQPRKLTTPPSRVVSDTKEGSLKITIRRDSNLDEVKLEMEKSPKSPENAKENRLADMEYSDLEDISPGRLSLDSERPASPGTPETAIPAPDFTHPSLGFWAAPMMRNDEAKTAASVAVPPMISDEFGLSEANVLPMRTQLSYVDDQQVVYGASEGSILGDSVQEHNWPEILPSVDGFFCQTTTSEERDLNWALGGQSEVLSEGAMETSYHMDDAIDRYNSEFSQGDEDEISRFNQSEVFEYRHGMSEDDTQLCRNSSPTESRGAYKDYKHRSTTRVRRYPWISRERGQKGQLGSTGGEGQNSAEQSATGGNTGCDESRLTNDDNPVKRCKVENSAQSTKEETSPDHKMAAERTRESEPAETDQQRHCEIMVFAWMTKLQLSNWIKRKRHGVKLAAGEDDERQHTSYAPEAVRRFSERMFRRVKRRLRQSSRSSSNSPSSPEMHTTGSPDFDFDDVDLESEVQKTESDWKEVGRNSGSKEVLQDNALSSLKKQSQVDTIVSLAVNDVAKNCTVNNDEHPSTLCTRESLNVHKNLHFFVSEDCKEGNASDLMCDEEVAEILEDTDPQGGEQVAASNPPLEEKNNGVIVQEDNGIMIMDVDKSDSCNNVHEPPEASKDSSTMFFGLPFEERHSYFNLCGQGNIVDCVTKETNKIVKDPSEQGKQQAAAPNDGSLCKVENTANGAPLDRSVEKSTNHETSGVEEFEVANRVITAKDAVEVSKVDIEEGIGHTSKVGKDCHVEDCSPTPEKLNDNEVSRINVENAKDGIKLSLGKEPSPKDFMSAGKCDDNDGAAQKSISSCLNSKPTFDILAKSGEGDALGLHPEFSRQRSVDENLYQAPPATQSVANKANGSPFVVSSAFSSPQLGKALSSPRSSNALNPDEYVMSSRQHSLATPMTPPITVHPVLPPQSPAPAGLMWPVMTYTGPFPAAPNNSLEHPNPQLPYWTHHPPPVPVSCGLALPATTSDDICPPGTEDEHRELCSGVQVSLPAGYSQPALTCHICPPGTEGEYLNHGSQPLDTVPLQCAQPLSANDSSFETIKCPDLLSEATTRNAAENGGCNQAHGNVMDHSMVNALMQFYSEISEFEGSENENEKEKHGIEREAYESIPDSLELKRMAGGKDQELNDMGMESDMDGSLMDISDADVSEIDEADNAAFTPVQEDCIGAQLGSTEKLVAEGKSLENVTNSSTDGVSASLDSMVNMRLAVQPASRIAISQAVNAMQRENTTTCGGIAADPAPSVTNPGNGTCATQTEDLGTSNHVSSKLDILPADSPSLESSRDAPLLSPIDPVFLSNAEHTIFSSIGDLSNLLGRSSSFDRIAEEAISSTVHSLENVLHQARNHYAELSSCPSDSGLSAEEELCSSSRMSCSVPVSAGPVEGSANKGHLGTPTCSSEETVAKGADKQFSQKKLQMHRKRFRFFVYSPEHDKECDAVKNYMIKAGGAFVDIKDPACLEENSRELKVLIRRKHLPSVHRLANLYQLKMSPCVKFALFNTLADVARGSSLFENIFVSGGVLLADDVILKTIEIELLDALLSFMKKQSLQHQKFVWVLKISRNGYKRLSMTRPLTKRDSKVLALVRRYKDQDLVKVLNKGYVTDSIPATQRYLHTTLKLQTELSSVYRHIILLSDMNKTRVEVPWFLERGIGVMKVQEFLTAFAGPSEAKNLPAKQPQRAEGCSRQTSTVTECGTPEDETSLRTPDGTPASDSSNDSPVTDTRPTQVGSAQSSLALPQKRAVRSLSWHEGTMTETRLQILSCVRSVRDNIRSQISTSNPSSPVGRSV